MGVRGGRLEIWLLGILLALGIAQMTLLIGSAAYQTFRWESQIRVAEGQVHALKRQVAVLSKGVTAMQNSAYLRELARCFGFVGAADRILVDPQHASAFRRRICRPLPLLGTAGP